MLFGTLVNVLTVIAGSLIGLAIRGRLSPKMKEMAFQGIGLTSLVIGIYMALKVEQLILLIFSVLIGCVIGQALDLEKQVERFSKYAKARLKFKDDRFTHGLITAFLIFCIGSFTIVGALNEGLTGDSTLILSKAVLDGFTSIALAATYGVGVMFVVIPLFIYQGSITLLAQGAKGFFSQEVVNQITSVGGVLIIGIGLDILNIKKIRVTNMLPALLVAVALALIFKA